MVSIVLFTTAGLCLVSLVVSFEMHLLVFALALPLEFKWCGWLSPRSQAKGESLSSCLKYFMNLFYVQDVKEAFCAMAKRGPIGKDTKKADATVHAKRSPISDIHDSLNSCQYTTFITVVRTF